jgi:PAS domain S-box-containing protein
MKSPLGILPLRILHLEDDPQDAELIQETLEAEGISCHITCVETETDFVASLQRDVFDLILADYTLPSFDGLSAMKIAQSNWPQVPFIFVSGTLDEEVAIEALKIGATDYVFKTRLSRIVPSVQRALREAGERTELRRAEEALRRSEAYLAEAQRLSHTGSFGWDVSNGEIYWSQETFRIFDYEPAARVPVEAVVQRTHPEDRLMVQQLIDRVSHERESFDFEHRLLMPDGSVKYLRVVGHPSKSEAGNFEFVGAVTDITERKRAEEVLQQSEERFRTMADTLPDVLWITALHPQQVLYVSPSFARIWGLPASEFYGNPRVWTDAIHPQDRAAVIDHFTRWISGEDVPYDNVEYRILQPNGATRWIHERGVRYLNEQGKAYRVSGIATDITDRKQAEADLQKALDEIKKLRDQLYKENIALREEIDKASMFEEIVGESPALQTVLARVTKVAPMDSTVLITGETGTGKELIARAIHKRSRRFSRAFVTVNCAATPASLIASELFGHEKGAFTGALQRRLGKFELAEGGTIFLDEVGELPAETQITLLRVLQEREFERLGGSQSIRADVRVIAATNRDLETAITGGDFRRDLFYRLNVFPIEIPPLRERKGDIPTLIEYFVHRYSRKAGKKIATIEKRTLELLESYGWPGNIRELQNVIERSVIVCETDTFSVDPSWLSFETFRPEDSTPIARKSPAQEKEAIETALAATAGRVSGPAGAAAQLDMPASTLESKIRSLKINKFRFKKI